MNKITHNLNNKEIEKLGATAITDFYKTMAIDTLTLPGLNAFITGDNSPSLNVLIDTRDSLAITVMIHNLATRNKFLKQGFGTALTLHMMSVAKKAGYKHCFLDSSDEGFNLYSRLGFKVYGKTWVYEKDKVAT